MRVSVVKHAEYLQRRNNKPEELKMNNSERKPLYTSAETPPSFGLQMDLPKKN